MATLFLNWNNYRTIQTAHNDNGVFAERGTVLPRGFLFLSIFRETPYLRLSKMQKNLKNFKKFLSKEGVTEGAAKVCHLSETRKLEWPCYDPGDGSKMRGRERERGRERRIRERRETWAETLGLFTDFWLSGE